MKNHLSACSVIGRLCHQVCLRHTWRHTQVWENTDATFARQPSLPMDHWLVTWWSTSLSDKSSATSVLKPSGLVCTTSVIYGMPTQSKNRLVSHFISSLFFWGKKRGACMCPCQKPHLPLEGSYYYKWPSIIVGETMSKRHNSVTFILCTADFPPHFFTCLRSWA